MTEWRIGPEVEVGGERQLGSLAAFTRRYGEALRRREHLWVAVTSFLVTPPFADGMILDPENMAGPPAIGCYICEVAYEPRMARRSCPGEPG